MVFSSSLNELILKSGLNAENIARIAQAAINEDLNGATDVTSVATIPEGQLAVAQFSNRKSGVIAGALVVAALLEICGITDYKIEHSDGEFVQANSLIISARGKVRAILLVERSALNFLGHLSGIATLTKSWVDAVADTKVAIRDTRKTTPGMRELEKYAVRAGGGVNHRLSLSDCALIKDNHVLSAGGVFLRFFFGYGQISRVTFRVAIVVLNLMPGGVDAGDEFLLFYTIFILE